MMNNKGQTLVIFVLILPLIILTTYVLLTKGNMYYQKRLLENNIKSALNYGLDHTDDENIEIKVKELIKKNIEAEIIVTIENNFLIIKGIIEIPELQEKIGFKNLEITYKGYKENNKNILIKE